MPCFSKRFESADVFLYFNCLFNLVSDKIKSTEHALHAYLSTSARLRYAIGISLRYYNVIHLDIFCIH